MTPFLQQVASVFYDNLGDKISNTLFVFPNRRSGIFFQKYLAIEAKRPLFSPKILTINEIFGELTDYKIADRTTLLFRLYKIYVRVSNSTESFDDFVYWGEMLLNDFDDVDKYIVDAEKLFHNITDLKEIESEFAYLEEAQIDIIRKFWSHFIPSYESEKKMNFARTWEVLFEIYKELRRDLMADKLAYEGMIFRDVVERLERKEIDEMPFRHVVFVGLNAMTTAERILLTKLRDMGVADFYWDYIDYTLTDRDNKASFFAFDNIRQFPSRYKLEEKKPELPSIEVIGIPSAVGQAKCAYSILEEMVRNGDIPEPSHAMNTAVVLPDENLLMPVLYSIPRQINPINVTMGYSLKSTPISGLMEHIFELQQNIKWENGLPYFYFRSVEPILTHRYVTSFDQKASFDIINRARKENTIYIPQTEFRGNELFELIFKGVASVDRMSVYLRSLLEYLQGGLEDDDAAETDEDSAVVELTELEKEFIYHYYITLNRLADVMNLNDVKFSTGTYFKLLRKMTDIITIPFSGEPLSGLQIMGVLETRALDFENLIILSMNEGVFPLKKAASSFIPFNLRKGFGLSTTEHQDSVYAYHFYRMISRAKKVYLLYDTRDSGMQTGEVSRYIYQMKFHYNYPLIEKTLSFDISVTENAPIEVEKTPKIMAELERYLQPGKRTLSASAINKYIGCPLQFYFHYIEGMKEEDDVSENLEVDQFGTIYHAVMEDLYNRSKGQIVAADNIRKVLKDDRYLTDLIRQKFIEHYLKSDSKAPLSGMNYLLSEVFLKYVRKSLEEDIKLTPFIYVESEMDMKDSFRLSDGREVYLTGSIDRVTEKEGVVSIVDYKTGSGKTDFKSMAQLFDKEVDMRPKQVMQVMMYAMMYYNKCRPAAIEPHIFYLRDFYKENSQTIVECKPDKNEEDPVFRGKVHNFLDIQDEFIKHFRECLEEIFNKDMPFCATTDDKICKYCPYTSVCRK